MVPLLGCPFAVLIVAFPRVTTDHRPLTPPFFAVLVDSSRKQTEEAVLPTTIMSSDEGVLRITSSSVPQSDVEWTIHCIRKECLSDVWETYKIFNHFRDK
jgi:hypothetical protein